RFFAIFLSHSARFFALEVDARQRPCDMGPSADRVESLLAAAVDIDSEAQRRAFVERACAGDGRLRRRVEELIENHFRAGSFLESPAPKLVATVDQPLAGPLV